MKYRLFGNSGLRVSEVSLGTMTFREDWGWGAPKDESRKIYDAYRKAGGNFIDTANLYTNGSSENLAGEFIHDHRQSVVLATKYTNPMAGDDPNAAGNHRKSMVQALEASLRRLKTDYIDLYWLHTWDLVRQGKILYIGVSDAPAWWIAQANTLAGMRGWTQFIGLQIEYSLIERTVERELIPMAKAFKLGLVAWSPLAGGLLSGKYHSGGGGVADARFSTEMGKSFRRSGERPDRVVAALKKVSQEVGRPPRLLWRGCGTAIFRSFQLSVRGACRS
jgi:aryl-alcohol dehydrogenase-like predicted oxidoreductase